ncbi:GNAT family N-acetyltransferase [uncultured Paraglaciecola sp.]|uniref:GNAT family N-acetyltransferase n=1 Tax=uncultured Paraglaciecola sp. TaxID=1765024 RepID=UPI0030DBB6DE
MQIQIDDLTHPKVVELLQQHLDDMYATSPAESVHALDLEKLRQPDITFWTVWQQQDLLGCGALKALSSQHAEIKSMRTSRQHLRKGVATHILEHIIMQAKARELKRISLETGSQAFFKPAIALYKSYNFKFCEPFADYQEDPNSKFMTLVLGSAD